MLGLARLGVLRARDALFHHAAHLFATVRLVAAVAAAGTLAVPHPRRALIHACAGMGRKALHRAGQRCKLVLSRLAVRLDFTSVETEKFIIIYAVQIRL